MLDFAALPPEVNSGLMYTGPGSGPMLTAAAAWDDLAAELYSAAASYGSVISDLASGWLGPSSVSMAAAAAPYVSWMATTAAQAEESGSQAKAAVAAYEAAFVMTVPPPVIAANRALLLALIATNFFGQNTPAIMATEAQYMEMWAQDAAAMYGYQAAAQAAWVLSPFTAPAPTTSMAGLAGQATAVGQALSSSAGSVAQTVAPLTTAMSTPLSYLVSTPLTTAAPNAVPGLAAAASSMSSSSATSPLSMLTVLTSSSTALTSGTSLASGTGSSVSISAAGMSAVGSTTSFLRSVVPTAGILVKQFQALGFPLGNSFGSGMGVFCAPDMGSSAVTAGVGRAASLGALSVPQNWTTAAPEFSHVGSALPGTAASASPAVTPSAPGGMPSGMPLVANMPRGMSAPVAPAPRLGIRPTVVQTPVYAG